VVTQALPRALAQLEIWIAHDLVKSLVYGGQGLQGISQTEFYKFITSPEGLSQLGITSSEPPKLLKAYETAFKVSKKGGILSLDFGDLATLKAATPHPAAGTGHLTVQSWLELALDKKTIGRGFVPRDRIKRSSQGSIRLDAPLGGLMLPKGAFGSSGLWRFPEALSDFESKWVGVNADKIQDLIFDQFSEFLNEALNG
jgi:hypothetical protein